MHSFTHQRWPYSKQSLLPHGGEATLTALVKLSRPETGIGTHEVPNTSLLVVIAYCHPVVSPFFVTSPYLLECIVVGQIHHANDRLERALSDSLESYEAP